MTSPLRWRETEIDTTLHIRSARLRLGRRAIERPDDFSKCGGNNSQRDFDLSLGW